MIVDKVCNISKYCKLIPNLKIGLESIKDAEQKEIGKYIFDGGYFLIQEGQTKLLEDGLFETHKRYIDVQIILSGKEEIAWLPLDELTAENEYDEQADKQKFTGPKLHHMSITEGMFWIAFPWDGHQALAHVCDANDYRKIVLKLPFEEEK